MHVADVLADLLAEQEALDPIVAALSDADWDVPTASPRWSVVDQLAHLTYFDHSAAFAIEHPDRWSEETDRLWGALGGEADIDALTLGPVRALPPSQRYDAWTLGRQELARAALALTDDGRVPWYGPSMGAKSFLTARLMECWAHGQDIVDAVGAERPASDRLRHIAQLGYLTRGWSYINRKLDPPDGEIRLELEAPTGASWVWGPEDGAVGAVRGRAEDFCLVVTQRRSLDDVSLALDGPAAHEWMGIAQAFAGPPTDGPSSPQV